MGKKGSERATTFRAVRVQIVRIPAVVEVRLGDADDMQVRITGPKALLEQIELRESDGVLQISGPQEGRRGGSVTNVATGPIGGSLVQAVDIHGGVRFDGSGVTVGRVGGPDITDDWTAVRIVVDMPQAAASAT